MEGTLGECDFVHPNITRDKDMVSSTDMNYERIDVPSTIMLDEGKEYCYLAVLSVDEGVIDRDGIVDGMHYSYTVCTCKS